MSTRHLINVIPAQAGIHDSLKTMDSRLRGNDGSEKYWSFGICPSSMLKLFQHAVSLLILVLLLPAVSLAESGQYRSKVLLSPVGEMEKNAGMSIEELEAQISSIEQPYARSSAGRHLARHYVEQGDYDKALEYYETALTAEGLSDIANREMLREVAQLQLLMEDYVAAVATLEGVLSVGLVPEATDYLLLAQSHYRLGAYVGVVAALDRLQEQKLTMTVTQTRQALALYYRTGAYAQCEVLLASLLKLESGNSENWHLLVSVYLQQNKKREALDTLVLAREKAVPFSEANILLLVDLHTVNENPYRAAEILSGALAAQEVEASGNNYRKLFELWFQAREKDKAQKALARAARLTGDTQLYLYLAQLQMDGQSWQAMHNTMLAACSTQLEDRYVSRANLLLGVSQLKLGDDSGARRSFINATLIGGATEQAGQWLAFMQAEPADKKELRRIVGACYGTEDKRAVVASMSEQVPDVDAQGDPKPDATDGASPGETFAVKTVPAMQLYYTESKLPLAQIAPQLKSIATRMSIALVRAQGTVDGPLHVIVNRSASGEEALQVAFPVRGLPAGRRQYKTRRSRSFECVYLNFSGPGSALGGAWIAFIQSALAQGHELTGQARMLVSTSAADPGTVNVEIQLGIH